MQQTLEQFLAMLWQKRDLQVTCLIVPRSYQPIFLAIHTSITLQVKATSVIKLVLYDLLLPFVNLNLLNPGDLFQINTRSFKLKYWVCSKESYVNQIHLRSYILAEIKM